MNKSYRIVWNRVRNCLMVVSETAKTQGKGGAVKSAVVGAVVAAVGALGEPGQVNAQTIWTTGNYTVSSNVTNGLLVRAGSVVGTLTVNAGSSINGATNGFEVSNATVSGDVINAGVIQGSNKGILIEASNPTSVHASVGGSIINSGNIIGSGQTGIQVRQATMSGGITNSGSIGGGYYGINVSASMLAGGISNGGTITGAANSGLLINRSTVSGGIRNAGYLSGQGTAALILSGASVAGGIYNSGTVVGSRGVYIYGNSSTHSSLSGGITNVGTIATTTHGINVERSTVSGLITNQAGGLIHSYSTGIRVTQSQVVGSISNAGLISGDSQQAIIVYKSTVVGSIINSGTLEGAQFGVNVSLSSVSGDISNTAGGTISGGNGLVVQNSTVAGSIINAAQITASAAIGYGINITNSSVAGGIQNLGGGTISGYGSAIRISVSSTSITNSGLIAAGSVNYAAVTANGTTVALQNSASGTIVGAINGTLNVTNAGLLALQAMSGSTISAGSHVNASISGNYVQNASTATLQIGVNGVSNSGTLAANFSHLTVSGIASLTAGSINVSMNNDSAVMAGGTLSGVVSSTSNQLTATGLTISDNSALVNFNYVTTAGALSLVSVANSSTCAGNISGSQQGPCEIAYDNQLITVAGSGSIGGAATGIKVLTGAITAGGIVNAGTVLGSGSAVNFLAGGTYTGNLTNSGLISGAATAGIRVASTINGSIINMVGGSIGGGVNGIQLAAGADIVGGIVNYGSITGGSGAGIAVLAGATLSGGTTSGQSYGLVNAAGGYISSISNAGMIRGLNLGIRLLTGSQVASGIVNSGQVYANMIALALSNATLSGGLSNTGLIYGVYYGMTQVGGRINGGLNNTGTIMGAVAGILLQSSTLSGGITNSGTIGGGIAITSGALVMGGLSNSGSITGLVSIDATSRVQGGIVNTAGHMNGVDNSGLITASGYGIAVNGGQVDGITNSGFIGGGTGAISVAGSATLNNIVITGNNTASFGGAVVAANTPVTVVGGATYTLNSNFEVANFNNQGTLNAPVASVATPTITGNITLGNTGTFSPTVASQTSYTQITVSGNASIAGALAVNAAAVTTITVGSTLAGVITAASVSGTFGSYTDNSVLYDFVPVYNGTMVGLAVVQNSSGTTYTSIAQSTGNLAALGVAGALQQISTMTGVMTPVTTAFGQMTSDQQISNAMSQTLPVMSGATTWNTMSVLSSINRIIEARHLQNKGISSGDSFYGNNAVWMKPFGSWMNQANQNGAYGFKANTGGLMLGADTIVEQDTRLGFAAAWGNTSAQSNAGVAPQTQSSNLYQFIGYGSYALTNTLEANFQANGGWNNNTSNRSIGFMGTGAQGSYSSAVWHVGAGLSNPFQVAESTQLIPSARFDYSWMRNSSYNETGASNGLGLNVAAQTYQMSILSADGKVVHKLNDHHSVNANIGIGYNFSPTQTNVAAAFQGAPTLQFTTNGINPSAVMGHAGVGYTYKIKDGIDLGVRYDLDFQNTYTNQTATAKARWAF